MKDQPRTSAAPEDTIVIVGVGLIGGSIAAAVKQRRLASRIVGVGRSAARLETAVASGLIDVALTDLREAAVGAGLLIFCTPVDQIAPQVREAAACCRDGALITDVGSVKGSICRELSRGLPAGVTFIGSHPLAGSERRGFEHADADLFEASVCVLTPESGTPLVQRSRLTHFWQSLGARVAEMSPADHDRAVAQTSHLPHVVAASLISTVEQKNWPVAASGLRDTTRIAAGDWSLWVPILLENAEFVLDSLDAFDEKLRDFRAALEARDPERLKGLLEFAKTNREGLQGRGERG